MPTNFNVDRAMAVIRNEHRKLLTLTFSSHFIYPGQFVSKRDAAHPPRMSFPRLKGNGTYMIVCLDLDAPFPSCRVLGPKCHWIQSGLEPIMSENGHFFLRVAAPFIANYVGPNPLPGSSPHRYLFILYEQPAGFELTRSSPTGGKKMGVWSRLRFDLDGWAREIGLGPVVGANYFVSR
ncbi:PEBP-like protein [Aspergillus eucalypticola CBS 122712]|uniref:PEBP-like protein n=1 Tax=Aspergillus eucalypticola (strain CBS 122712 / IBT 29274) TaxID=1448314 RepID=A0A317UTP3_ASPEC|nr:PEBP-like protein [Aspergillus eucalypticola CBS 122712]PWY65453.1 PEBP-like protein [Aspergillus eucalypticola CBS 122712]